MTETGWQILVLLLLIAVLLEGLLLVGVMRQLGDLMLRLAPAMSGPQDGGPEPGTTVPVADLRAQAGVLLFVSRGCAACEELLPGLPSLLGKFPELQFIGVPAVADRPERERYGESLPFRPRSDLYELIETWNIGVMPYAVSFDTELRIVGRGPISKLDQLEGLAVAAAGGANGVRDGHGRSAGRDGASSSAPEVLVVDPVLANESGGKAFHGADTVRP